MKKILYGGIGIFLFYIPSLLISQMDDNHPSVLYRMDFQKSSDLESYQIDCLPEYENRSESFKEGSKPQIEWLQNSGENRGLVKFTFSKPHQGLRLTLKKNGWIPAIENQWYQMETRIRSTAILSNPIEINSFLYDGETTGPHNISGYGIFSGPVQWFSLNIFHHAVFKNSSLYPQIVIRNRDYSPVTIYLDSIILREIPKPWVKEIPFPGGNFNTSSDMNYWEFELPEYANQTADYEIQSEKMMIYFNNNPKKGLKMTMMKNHQSTWTHPSIPGKFSGYRLNLKTMGDIRNNLISLASIGVDSAHSKKIREVAVLRKVNQEIPENTIMEVIYQPNYSYTFGQIEIYNSSNGEYQLDNINALLDNHIYLR